MRIVCRHGHIAFYPRYAVEISQFVEYWGVSLIRVDDYFTFAPLAELDRFSLAGLAYGNLTANTTYEGRNPWDVMRENEFVYHIGSSVLLPKSSIAIQVDPTLSSGFWVPATTLVQPGSRNRAGNQILSYSGEYNNHFAELKVSEYSYE